MYISQSVNEIKKSEAKPGEWAMQKRPFKALLNHPFSKLYLTDKITKWRFSQSTQPHDLYTVRRKRNDTASLVVLTLYRKLFKPWEVTGLVVTR